MWIQRIVDGLNSRPSRTEPGREDYPWAAVALLIHSDALLFIRRSVHQKDPWSGHMAFPGGRLDPSDVNLEQAARREVAEEIGIDLSDASLLGVLDQVASPALAPRIAVTPFVFALQGDPVVHPDPKEVASVHWMEIDALCRGDGRGYFPYVYGGVEHRLPCIDDEDRRIWGMTLRIVDDLLERMDVVHS